MGYGSNYTQKPLSKAIRDFTVRRHWVNIRKKTDQPSFPDFPLLGRGKKSSVTMRGYWLCRREHNYQLPITMQNCGCHIFQVNEM
jgi:hypothetical protein